MYKFYSETGAARTREIVADVATWAWVAFWAVIGSRVHDAISQFAEAGRVLQGGGTNIESAGATVGGALRGVPLIGEGIEDVVTGAFGTASQPFVTAGQELESLVVLIARLLAILVVAVFVVPWLFKYVPWRAGRLATMRAAHQAIRGRPIDVSEPVMQQALATRAINRLSYQELLEHTPDPLGDYVAGRYGGLAKAELANVGLR